MKKTYRKNVLRTVYKTLSRFGAIFAIVALGVGFLAGLLATTPDMRYSGDRYFDETHLFDVRVVSELGLTKDDVTAIRAVEGVADVMPSYSADMLVDGPDGNTIVARMHSVPLGTIEQPDAQGYLNRLEVIEGRLPVKEDECVIDSGMYTDGKFAVGDTITVSDDNKNVDETLVRRTYKIVGTVKSSYYFSMEREPASVGNGSIGLVLYTGEENFNLSVYTDVFLTVDGAAEENSLLQPYVDKVAETTTRIEEISDAQCNIRYDAVKTETEEKLADARTEFEEAKAEAEEKLSDAKAQLDEGRVESQKAEKELTSAKGQITKGEKELADNKNTLPGTLTAKQAELIAGKQALADAKSQYAANKTLLEQKQAELTAAKAALQQAEDAVARLTPIINEAQAQLPIIEAQLPILEKSAADAAAVHEERQKAIDDAVAAGGYADEAAWAAAEPLVSAPMIAARDAARTAYTTAEGQLLAMRAAKTAIVNSQTQLAEANAQIAVYKPMIAEAEPKLAEGKAQLAAAEKQILEAEKQLMAGETALGLAADLAKLQFDLADEKLEDSKSQLQDGEKKLADAKLELEKGETEYETQKKSAEEKLADAQQQIEDGEAALAELAVPEWYLLTRDSNVSFSSFQSNAEKVEAIAKVFPIFFFLVAALVALTTMTRMVEEERLQIGTMKALGYSKRSIMGKYIFYAMAASVLGSAFGLLVGFNLFPTVIWNAYTMMYTLPKLYCQFNMPFAIFSAGAAIICTLLATLNACWATLAECPAQLMLPRAPKAGKRILLERITPLWSRMKFTHKVTARNLFRYKKRFFMTVVGIAGCTALLVTGFGLHDSISDIVNKQFGDIFTYDLSLTLKREKALESESLQKIMNDPEKIDAWMAVHQEKSSNTYNGDTFSTYLFVPKEDAQMPQFVSLQHRVDGEKVPLRADGVVITEKMAERTGYGVGDTITLENNSHKKGDFLITGVAENYVENYVYMTADLYRAQYGTAPEYNSIVAISANNDRAARDALSAELLDESEIGGVNFIEDIKESFTNMMKKIDTIVVVLIVSAGLLAFVVLYNLTNINITERCKEIATIKVLGFFEREVSAYVYRESILLSLIGTACGLALGIFLHMFVIYNIEVDAVMFGRTIKPLSYLFAAALTMLFSMLVNLVMKKKLRNISMVESMKAPE